MQQLQRLLGVDAIDTFIVSFRDASSTSIASAWQHLEALHKQNTLGKLGVADFSADQLKSILSDTSVRVKPSINQINVSQCCNMPSEMIELAKQHGVELLHNGDCAGKGGEGDFGHSCAFADKSFPDILDSEVLSSLLRKHGVRATVSPQWVIKYHVFVRCRSVVSDKGYVLG